MSKEEHNKMAMIENLVWDAAKIIFPNSYIDPKKITKAKEHLLKSLNEK